MKKQVVLSWGILLLLLMSFTFKLSASKNDSLLTEQIQNEVSNLKDNVSLLKDSVNKISLDKEYIIKNYQIQNETILNVATILGILLTIVIVYFGWRAQKMENEYERAKNDRARINDQFDTFFNELNNKKLELDNLVKLIQKTKLEIDSQKK